MDLPTVIVAERSIHGKKQWPQEQREEWQRDRRQEWPEQRRNVERPGLKKGQSHCPSKDDGLKVPLTPEILQMLTMPQGNDGRQHPQPLSLIQRCHSIDSSSSVLTTSSVGSKNSCVSSASQLNRNLHRDAAISASVRRWHQVAAVWTSAEERTCPMVMCSPPGMLGQGRYVIRFLRVSLKQEFGIAFDVAEAKDGRLEAIIVSHDLPHFGIRKFDQLVSVNGVVPSSLHHCCSMLKEAYSIVLVLQPWDPKALECRPTLRNSIVMAALHAVDQPLVWLNQAVVTDPQKGEFKVALHRSSLASPFSIPDWSLLESEAAEDFPHLAVRRGDRLVSVNGVRTLRTKLCRKLLATAMSVDLVLRRDPNTQQPPKHHMQPLEAMGAVVRRKPSLEKRRNGSATLALSPRSKYSNSL